MALTSHANTNIANFSFTMTAETGVIVRSTSVSGQETSGDEVFDPVHGGTVLYGSHFSNTFELSITAVIAGNTGIMNATITTEQTIATSVALAGHVNNSGTAVTTGLTAAQEIGKFKTLEYTAKFFSSIA